VYELGKTHCTHRQHLQLEQQLVLLVLCFEVVNELLLQRLAVGILAFAQESNWQLLVMVDWARADGAPCC
jgi:hypothetical protein